MKGLYEKELVQHLEKKLEKDFDTDISFKEFSAGYGIADLVFAKNFFFKNNALERTPINNYYALNIFMALKENKPYHIKNIYSLFNFLNKPLISKQINFLHSNQYLEKINRQEYFKHLSGKKMNPIKKIIAIEVKLTDHKNGLIQALRYKYFADECYLALLKKKNQKIDLQQYVKHNIGLILFDENSGEIEYKNKPKIKTNNAIVNLFAKELLLNQFRSFTY